MKIDEELILTLLIEAEKADAGLLRVVSSDDGSPEQMKREAHAEYLEEQGLFIEVYEVGNGTYKITDKGHKYLDSKRR